MRRMNPDLWYSKKLPLLNEYSKDIFDLKRAQKILDRDHFGLEEVKEKND
jgi:ATP-dependent Lon protease